MGKKRTAQKGGAGYNAEMRARSLARGSKRKVPHGILHIQATYNNTKLLVTDKDGRAVLWSSSGSLGFGGTRKGTPYAAAKVGELVGEQAQLLGMQSADVVVRGVGAGREAALRAFSGKGIELHSIRDETPRPFNGPRAPKPRRV
ncbi:MAG: 30S ribosomal protein S11 [Parcubacteria group bacterium]|nr:30S ribosomal protein S11 [Parcubacteria group bacterium]